jgi:hypothetical protein
MSWFINFEFCTPSLGDTSLTRGYANANGEPVGYFEFCWRSPLEA